MGVGEMPHTHKLAEASGVSLGIKGHPHSKEDYLGAWPSEVCHLYYTGWVAGDSPFI